MYFLKFILFTLSIQYLNASPFNPSFNQEEESSRMKREIPFRFPIFEGVLKAFGSIAESTANATNQFVQGVGESFSKSSNAGSNDGSNSTKGLDQVKNVAEGFFRVAGAFFANAFNASGTFIRGTGDGLSQGASTMFSGFSENVDAIANLAKNGTSAADNFVKKAAQDLNNVV